MYFLHLFSCIFLYFFKGLIHFLFKGLYIPDMFGFMVMFLYFGCDWISIACCSRVAVLGCFHVAKDFVDCIIYVACSHVFVSILAGIKRGLTLMFLVWQVSSRCQRNLGDVASLPTFGFSPEDRTA